MRIEADKDKFIGIADNITIPSEGYGKATNAQLHNSNEREAIHKAFMVWCETFGKKEN